MNNITILGRVGREPELRTTQGGTTVLSFPVACSKKVQGNEITTWFDCSLFGKRAESLQQYIQKGHQISVSGEIEQQTWQKQDGTTGFKIALMVSNVGLVSGNSAPAIQKPQGGGGFAGQRQAPQPQANNFDDFEGDSSIPF